MRCLEASNVSLFAADTDPLAAGLYLVPPERRLMISPPHQKGFEDQVLGLCNAHNIDVVIPTIEAELLPLARAQARFFEWGTQLLLSEPGPLEFCIDKWLLYRALHRIVPMPQTRLFSKSLPGRERIFPIVLKERTDTESMGVRVIHNQAELAAIPWSSRLIVQEYIPGTEYAVDVLADQFGQILSVVPKEIFRVRNCVTHACRTIHDPALTDLAKHAFKNMGLGFISTLKFRRTSEGQLFLLDISPKFPSTTALTVKSGINMPEIALRSLLGLRPPSPQPDHKEVFMVQAVEPQFMGPNEMKRTLKERCAFLGQYSLVRKKVGTLVTRPKDLVTSA